VLALLVRPKYWPGHLAMLVCVAIATGLGLWQLGAWSQHRADAARDLAHERAVPLSTVMSGDSPFPGRSLGRPVSFSGTWLTDATVYVSGREHDGRRGYWVVTPVLVSGTQSAMPVVRGWSATTDAATPSGPVELSGWLEPTEGSGGVDQDTQDDVIPAMRIASLVELVDADLYSGYVVARDSSTDPGSLKPVQPAESPGVSAFTGLRNLLYAIEWWVFGAFAVFIWVRWCQDSLKDTRTADEVGAA
jgi:cytochrome oxidase assembly protein ShyY1